MKDLVIIAAICVAPMNPAIAVVMLLMAGQL